MATGDKIGDIYLRGDKSRCHAYWRPTDGTPDVCLCSIDLAAYTQHPQLRDRFVALAAEVALGRLQ
jgi:hypothetical protein